MKFVLQLDPNMGELGKLSSEELINWLFYNIDNTDCNVDIIMIEPHSFIEQECPCNNTKNYLAFKEKNIEIMKVIIDECHKRNIKVYFHHRFSEVDHARTPGNEGRNLIKKEHPDWIIKTWWPEGMWNLASKELQTYKLEYLKRILEEYEFDGICIDYLRHLPCLPVGKQWEFRSCVTEFMDKLKQIANVLPRKVAVGAKVPENEKACRADGFDLYEWVNRYCVDFLVAGSRSIGVDVGWFREVIGDADIQVYPCWDTHHVSDAYHFQGDDFYYGMLSNWVKNGANGIVAFNYAPAPRKVLEELLPKDDIWGWGEVDYAGLYHIVQNLRDSNRNATYVAERRGGYPFLTGTGGNNQFAPLPAYIPNDESPLDIPIEISTKYVNCKVKIRLVISNAKESVDRFKICLNKKQIEEFTLNYNYIDRQIFWPKQQPVTSPYRCYTENPSLLLLIEAEVDSTLLLCGINHLTISVVDRMDYFLDSDSINVERAEISVYRAKKKIFLIGDSIRVGYDKYVKAALEDVAEVYYPDENCRFAAYIVKNLYYWKEQANCGDNVDLVHWNAGLWDNLIMYDGLHLTPIELYKEYIERVCQNIKMFFPKAKMIFATSTSVREELYTQCKRYNKDTEEYNRVAVEIVNKYGGEINDLYALTKTLPLEYHSDMTHYYTKDGTKIISNQVIKCIEQSLGINGKKLNYDTMFAEEMTVVGL